MSLRDAFHEVLTYPKVRRDMLAANPEIPRQTKHIGEWLRKHNPVKYDQYYRQFIEG